MSTARSTTSISPPPGCSERYTHQARSCSRPFFKRNSPGPIGRGCPRYRCDLAAIGRGRIPRAGSGSRNLPRAPWPRAVLRRGSWSGCGRRQCPGPPGRPGSPARGARPAPGCTRCCRARRQCPSTIKPTEPAPCRWLGHGVELGALGILDLRAVVIEIDRRELAAHFLRRPPSGDPGPVHRPPARAGHAAQIARSLQAPLARTFLATRSCSPRPPTPPLPPLSTLASASSLLLFVYYSEKLTSSSWHP